MITITEEDFDKTFSIDLIQHMTSGEKFIVKCQGLWAEEGHCVGFCITDAHGPLWQGDIPHLIANPFDWEADAGLGEDLNITSNEYFYTLLHGAQ